jgi:omega-amidase
MQDLKVGLLQYAIYWQNPRKNHEHIKRLLSAAPDMDLLVFPETFNTGFTNDTKWAQTMDGESVQFLMEMSKEYDCTVMASVMIDEGLETFNRCVVCQNGKVLCTYDKVHLFSLSNEDQYFAPGTERIEFECKGWKILPLICYDLRFPEISRNTTAYDLLVYVANWPKKRSAHWKKLLPARAIENQAYVLGCNRIGTDANDIHYSGDSVVLDAKGSSILEAHSEPGLFVSTLEKEDMLTWRKQLSALKDRKF